MPDVCVFNGQYVGSSSIIGAAVVMFLVRVHLDVHNIRDENAHLMGIQFLNFEVFGKCT